MDIGHPLHDPMHHWQWSPLEPTHGDLSYLEDVGTVPDKEYVPAVEGRLHGLWDDDYDGGRGGGDEAESVPCCEGGGDDEKDFGEGGEDVSGWRGGGWGGWDRHGWWAKKEMGSEGERVRGVGRDSDIYAGDSGRGS